MWVHRGEHLNLPEGGKRDAGIPDPSRLTPTSVFVSSVLLAEGEGSGHSASSKSDALRYTGAMFRAFWGSGGRRDRI